MHHEAREWVADFRSAAPLVAVDLGGRSVNGTARDLFPNASWTVVDVRDGDDVDVVADAATWQPDGPVDLVLCCEVFEHTPQWREIVSNIAAMLVPGGRAILTMAGPARRPHERELADPAAPDGYYDNIEPAALRKALTEARFHPFTVSEFKLDLRASAVKP